VIFRGEGMKEDQGTLYFLLGAYLMLSRAGIHRWWWVRIVDSVL